MDATLEPMGDRVVVEPIAEEHITRSGIIIPDAAREKPHRGVIVAMGPMVGVEAAKERDRLGIVDEHVPLGVGDEVLYSKYGGTELKIDLREIVLLREDDIFGRVIEPDAVEPVDGPVELDESALDPPGDIAAGAEQVAPGEDVPEATGEREAEPSPF